MNTYRTSSVYYILGTGDIIVGEKKNRQKPCPHPELLDKEAQTISKRVCVSVCVLYTEVSYGNNNTKG